MKYTIYSDYIAAPDLSVFEFTSVGAKGAIKKRIAFIPTDVKGVYNLAFGDIDTDDGIDDYNVTDNGDRNKILATVANAVDEFTRRYPMRWVYFRGSTEERTRLYRMAVGLNLTELSAKFEIYAETIEMDEFVPFRKNMNLQAFLIKRKII